MVSLRCRSIAPGPEPPSWIQALLTHRWMSIFRGASNHQMPGSICGQIFPYSWQMENPRSLWDGQNCQLSCRKDLVGSNSCAVSWCIGIHCSARAWLCVLQWHVNRCSWRLLIDEMQIKEKPPLKQTFLKELLDAMLENHVVEHLWHGHHQCLWFPGNWKTQILYGL